MVSIIRQISHSVVQYEEKEMLYIAAIFALVLLSPAQVLNSIVSLLPEGKKGSTY
jgi:hypothetical protein